MMNANEAKTLTNTYIANAANELIKRIEEHITENANEGHSAIIFTMPNNTRSDVRFKVYETIKEAGYHVSYGTNSCVLNINWRD